MKILSALIVSALTVCLMNLLAGSPVSAGGPRIIYERDSLYHHITITQSDSELCMLFGRYKDRRQTCLNRIDPDIPVLEYTAMMFVGFVHRPDTKTAALIGLGGGYMPLIFREYLPHVELDVIEVDKKVVELAKEYFGFRETDTVRLTIADGRQYLKKTPRLYDQIWLDAYNGDYIPVHLTTREFLRTTKARLHKNGVVVANVHNGSQLFDAQVMTFRSVFTSVFVYNGTENGNSIIVATENSDSEPTDIVHNALQFGGRIGMIELRAQMEKYTPNPALKETRILTDDYNPANLLHHRKKGGKR
ncbi:MAG: fused MFS/spermidine synthase [Deltaproteobacteria bacterium]|nr:fused MFS/spermidine synthase [Deltaproteobacteria bacterium]